MALELFVWCNSDSLWILTILAGYYIFYQFVLKTWWYFDQRDVKYVRGWPIVGSRYRSILGIGNERDTLQSLYNTYPDEAFIGVYDLFGRPSYIIRDLYLVKQLSATTSVWPNKESSGRSKRSSFFSVQGRDSDVTDDMCALFSDCAKEFCESLLLVHFKDVRSNDYDAKDLFGRYASNVVGWSALGNRINTLDDLNSEYYRTCCSIENWRCVQKSRLCDYMTLDAIKHFLNSKIVGDKDVNFFRSVVERKIENRLKSRNDRADMIDFVIKNAKEGDHDKILTECLEHVWNAFYMVHTVMPFLVHELALNPEIQTNLFNELSSVRENPTSGGLDQNSLAQLKYMDMVINETLRRWSPIQFSRKYMKSFYSTDNSDVKVDPNFIELNVGDSIWIPTHAIHMDEQYFPNPERFDPERFNDANRPRIIMDSFYPFGTEEGDGEVSKVVFIQIKSLLFHLLSVFIIDKCDLTKDPLRLQKGVSYPDSAGGFWIDLRKRN